MPERLPRLLCIMGSGETSPTMSRVHRDLFARLGPGPVPAVILDTPFGFQENADDIVARATRFFRESVRRDVGLASYRSADEVGSIQHETMLNRLREAAYVFSGPGSPSFALAQWQGTQVPVLLADKLHAGGCITFASAAAVTLGAFALPIYEIYKVGQAPHWLEGLNLLAGLGLDAVVVPHFDNAEGGTHDTRYCYMGERRLSALEATLPETTFVLGVDEHTACLVDLDQGTASVAGRGSVTVRRRDRTGRLPTGETIAVAELPHLAGAAPAATRPGSIAEPGGASPPESAFGRAASPLLDELARLRTEFDQALATAEPTAAVKAALGLEELLVEWSRDTLQSDEPDRARAELRSMIVRLGERAEHGARDPRPLLEPLVEALLQARDEARVAGRWTDADAIRDRLLAAGVEVRDTPAGTSWTIPEDPWTSGTPG